jgi:hypothetical protein
MPQLLALLDNEMVTRFALYFLGWLTAMITMVVTLLVWPPKPRPPVPDRWWKEGEIDGRASPSTLITQRHEDLRRR